MDKMKGVKISCVGPAHPLRGGLASFSERLSTEFMSQGAEVKIHSFSLQYPKILFPGKTQYSSAAEPEKLEIISEINSINPINWIRVGNRIRKSKPDLVIIKYWLPFMGPALGTIARRIKKDQSIKIVALLHNIIPHEKRFMDRQFTNYFVKPIDGFLAMSEQVLKDLDEFDTQKPRLQSPHPIFDNFGDKQDRDEAIKDLKLDPSKRYVLFFGIIRNYKGLDLLIEAFNQKSIRDKDLRLIIAGEYYDKEEKYDDLIAKFDLTQKVIKINRFIPNEEVGKIFSVADLLCLPYKSATQSGVTQIGFHFNIPMIVTNVGGLPEIILDEKIGYVVDQNAKNLANAICRYYDENKAEEFRKNLEIESKRYSWPLMVESFKKLFHQL